jgi:hypothetical protein
VASKDHIILNQIIVGNVLTVDDQIKDKLVISAKMYSHQNCTPKIRPGIIIAALVIKAKNSTVFGRFQ